jgi:hypothetical protein
VNFAATYSTTISQLSSSSCGVRKENGQPSFWHREAEGEERDETNRDTNASFDIQQDEDLHPSMIIPELFIRQARLTQTADV